MEPFSVSFQNQLPENMNRSIYELLPTMELHSNRKFALITSNFIES